MQILLTKKQTADMCNVSPATLDKWVLQGVIPPPVPGMRPKRWYVEVMKHHLRKITGMAPANDDGDDETYDRDLEDRIDQWGK